MSLKLLYILPLFLMFPYQVYGKGFSCSDEQARFNTCPHLVKMNSAAGHGKCLPGGTPSDISALFQRNNVSVYTGRVNNYTKENTNHVIPQKDLSSITNLSDPKVVALAKVINAFEKIGGGLQFLKTDSLRVVFHNGSGNSANRYAGAGQVQISPATQNRTGTLGQSSCGGMDNMGVLAHEIGHWLGNRSGRKIYNDYYSQVSPACNLTSYARSGGRHEEFAEVFAAYVLTPQLFEGKGSGCRRAFEFMQDIFSEPGMVKTCEARRNSYSSTLAPEGPVPRPLARQEVVSSVEGETPQEKKERVDRLVKSRRSEENAGVSQQPVGLGRRRLRFSPQSISE